MTRRWSIAAWVAFSVLLARSPEAQAELVLKILVVNPSETEVKEFAIRNPLPPEVKAEHVLDADGLKVDYDSQGGTRNVTLGFLKRSTANQWYVEVYVEPSSDVNAAGSPTHPNGRIAQGTITFGTDGAFSSATLTDPDGGALGTGNQMTINWATATPPRLPSRCRARSSSVIPTKPRVITRLP